MNPDDQTAAQQCRVQATPVRSDGRLLLPSASWDHMTSALLTAGVVFSAAAHAVAVLLLAFDHLNGGRRLAAAPAAALTLAGGALVASLVADGATSVLAAGVVVAAASGWALRVQRDFRPSGSLLCATYFALAGFGVAWSAWFVMSIEVNSVTRGLLLAAAAFGLILLPSVVVQNLESWEVLARRTWRRPSSRREASPGFSPRIEIQVPTHNEPPDVVCETLDRLSELDYDNFSVLVIDNNTDDPAIWKPLEDHCRALGNRFRFVHREGLTGAKAGALNYTLAHHTDPHAELIAVVDADYHVERDWLKAVVGHFEDPEIGFVQTPHAYRNWEDSLYQRMCAWEYAFFFHTTMRSLNEHRAALTVGTMCVIRREALENAGGWAEWCLTEDSELAIRIHALGYSSVYMTEVFGRGLIPETFDGYKKQRFRWTYGPIQELKRHARLFLPQPWGRPSRLDARQRIHHGNHGLDRAGVGLGLLAMPLLAATVTSMIVHDEVVRVPVALWIASTVLLAATLVARFLTYRVAVRASFRDTLGGLLAAAALSHVITMASARAVLGGTTKWRRTDKFRASSNGIRALLEASTETTLAAVFFALSAAAIALSDGGMVTMMGIGFAMTAASYLAAPALAVIADRDVRNAREREVAAATAALLASAASAPAPVASAVEWTFAPTDAAQQDKHTHSGRHRGRQYVDRQTRPRTATL